MTQNLVIGGTLFIGRALVEQLLERKEDVTVMHRGQGTPYGDRVKEIRCDRNDVSAVQSAMNGQTFDVVYDNVYDWERGTSGEVVAAAARAAAGPRLHRYVFMSSVGAYGGGLDLDEYDPLAPSDYPFAYSAHKADSERALFRLQREEVVPVSILRPTFVYGPGNPFQREAWFWDRIAADHPVIVPGDGSGLMQWVHVRDVARAAVLAATSDRALGRAYNLGHYPPITHEQWIDLLGGAAQRPVRKVRVSRERIQAAGGNPFAPPMYFGEFLDLPPFTVKTERVRSELGLDLMPLEEGLRHTFDWYRRQNRPAPDFSWEDRLIGEARV